MLSKRLQFGQALGWILAGSVVLMLAGLTVRRNLDYASEFAIWQDTVNKRPNNPRGHNNLGLALGLAGRVGEAIAHYEQALRIKPDYAEAHNNLGVVLGGLGKLDGAIGHFRQALQVAPDYAEAHYNLGLALAQLGKVQEAIQQYEQALRIKPKIAKAHYHLGIALEQTGKVQEAVEHYEQALRVDPSYTEAQNKLARALATLSPMEGGDPTRAVALAERVCYSTGHHAAPYLDTLAAAYAAAGRFNEAIATAEKAIELAGSAGQPQVAKEIEARLQLYRSGHP